MTYLRAPVISIGAALAAQGGYRCGVPVTHRGRLAGPAAGYGYLGFPCASQG